MLQYIAASCALLALLCAPPNSAAIHKRSGARAANALGTEAEATPTQPKLVENTDLLDKLSWKCANNASCLHSVANGIVASYRRGETIKLGLFDLVRLPPLDEAHRHKWGSGRALSSFMDFVSGNAIRVPVGPMVFSVQRAEDDSDYIEVALLKKASSGSGRLQGNGGGGGGLLGGGGGLLGGGNGGGGGLLGGGGDGGGGGGLLGGRRRQQHQDKKQFQMYIPMYLAATTFGWTMVAAKAVGLLTLKALILSKIAFVVAAIVLIKKLMDNAGEKMMYQYPEHTPYMMPYGMDYPMHAAELSPDMFPGALHQLAMAGGGQLPHPGHPGLESMAAESHLQSQVSSDGSNNTNPLAALGAYGGLGHKIKREDSWIAKSKSTPARRPLIYNYVQPQMQLPFYRS
ncbi:uncharacterized protein LOC115764157 isoform X1 [Drosophila novamexicana]|uniref:uncharacterized protein LOC115764157 isoform X1 n=1 Tax=Drosophila novamexicana TaxID=47314 RepID=UPI0011E59727|nr:uncharacterized protein LOC115764157 isoform X1 [Drosophila novamexicana]